jgi:hypothetical protein
MRLCVGRASPRRPWFSLGMEGKFCREGLQSLEEDDDMLTAMARELVTERGIGESATEVWRQIQAEHGMVSTTPSLTIEDAVPAEAPLVTSWLNMPLNVNAPKFGSRAPSERPVRRKEASHADLQFSLF